MDEPEHPKRHAYAHDHTKAWSARIAASDAFVIVTPEYNSGSPPALVNALDYLYDEWSYKPAAFVSYGGPAGGARSVVMTKQILHVLKVVPIYEGVTIPFFSKHMSDARVFEPPEVQAKAAATMLDELLRWHGALRVLR